MHGSLILGQETHPRAGTKAYTAWRINQHRILHFTHIRKLNEIFLS